MTTVLRRQLRRELFRPLAIAAISMITVVHLVDRPPRLPELTWTLTVVAIAAAVTSVLVLDRLPDRWQIALVTVYVVASAPLFALASGTAGVAFVFLATSMAGRQLESRRVAIALAIVASLLAQVSTWLAEAVGVPDVPQWWLCMTAGMAVAFGLIRRERDAALAAAEYGERQSLRAAALEERGRIAREIHDVVGHSLSGIAVQLDMADALHAAGRGSDANEAVRRARALAVSGLKETRRAVHALREDSVSLPESVAQLAESHGASLRVLGEASTVSVEIAQAVIRATQEALTNAHKYAPGADVKLLLEYEPSVVRLTVTDSGSGQRAGVGDGMGLVGMRERAALLGGTVSAGPDGPGWTVRMELPR